MIDETVYEKYEHHGKEVWVKKELKGLHRVYCLCYDCIKFHPGKPIENCQLAQKLYEFDVDNNMTTPVWECPEFE